MVDQPGPLIPRPAITLIALALTLGMLGNIWLDSQSVDYEGGQATLVLAALIAGILGVPIGVAAFQRQDRTRPTITLEKPRLPLPPVDHHDGAGDGGGE